MYNKLKYFIYRRLSKFKQECKLLQPKSFFALKSIKKQLAHQESLDPLDFIRLIRNWVNINSVHLIDDEHDSYAFKIEAVVVKLLNYSEGKGQRPHLSCGPRAYAMKEILCLFGIRSRVIDIFELVECRVNAHTLLEVYCEQLGVWILQDPDFNVEYFCLPNSNDAVSCERVYGADDGAVKFNTNGFQVENEINCINTIARCFDGGIMYRYSYDGKCSVFEKATDSMLSALVFRRGQLMTFKEYIEIRGYNPQIKIDYN